VLVYRVLRGDITYHDPGAAAYQKLNQTRVLRNLRQRAQQLGFALINIQTGEVLGQTASKRVAPSQVS
jgi:transposase